MSGEWKKKNSKDKIWWWYDNEQLGILRFSFDKRNYSIIGAIILKN